MDITLKDKDPLKVVMAFDWRILNPTGTATFFHGILVLHHHEFLFWIIYIYFPKGSWTSSFFNGQSNVVTPINSLQQFIVSTT